MYYHKIRKTIRSIYLDIIGQYSKPKPGIHILNGHFLSLDNNAKKYLFENLIIKLLKLNIEFINFDTATELISQKKIPERKCKVAFTFDDGFEECFTKIAPVLDKYKIKAAFFINPNFINGDEDYKQTFKDSVVFTNKPPMNWDQIKQLNENGHSIGAHTMDHLELNINNKEILEHQITECKKVIENKLNKSCNYFAFPYGRLRNISLLGVDIACNSYNYVFSQDAYTQYYSFDNRVINRRHFECDWPYRHVAYFLKTKSF